jgi:FMN reductase
MTHPTTRTRRTLAVVSAGLRQPSSTRLLADRLTDATVQELGRQGIDVDVRVVELREHAHALTDALLTGFTSGPLREAVEAVTRADGVIAVTPIFSGSYNGMFKNFVDVLEQGTLAGTPVLLGATAGTARHSLALEHELRPLFAYLRSVVVPTAVFAATDDFGAVEGAAEDDEVAPLAVRVDRAARELADLVASRPARSVADPFADPVSFEDLLAGR